MRTIKITFIVAFCIILVLPLAFMNHKPDSVSYIDNRKLTENPFKTKQNLKPNIEKYVNDRIGFRDAMITTFTVLNDKMFGKMVHPSYQYGRDGYVFGAGLTVKNDFGKYHIAYADMVKSIQNYCEERGIPFIFVFNPAKPAIYQDKLPRGMNYNRDWVKLFIKELDKRKINYIDNTVVFQRLTNKGVECFNRKYDANHWNAIGAFYGTNAILHKLKEFKVDTHINSLSEFEVGKDKKTSLLVSKFPIDEDVPIMGFKFKFTNKREQYFKEIKLHPSFKGFGYFINDERKKEGSPKVLFFQGSYMNGWGCSYMINALGEYIYVHDYQNIIDFPYYYNIFKPDAVVFEVAEYTLSNGYFDYNRMKAIKYNAVLSRMDKSKYIIQDVAEKDIRLKEGKSLVKIQWNTNKKYNYVWLSMDKEYDFYPIKSGYEVVVDKKDFLDSSKTFKIITSIR